MLSFSYLCQATHHMSRGVLDTLMKPRVKDSAPQFILFFLTCKANSLLPRNSSVNSCPHL